tara:strand:+ start:356 stop:751 length:396 start_codon:yes stop_codon:yes gene_type:complete
MNKSAKLLFYAVLFASATPFATAQPDNATYFCETFETVKLFADSDRKVMKIIKEVIVNYVVDTSKGFKKFSGVDYRGECIETSDYVTCRFLDDAYSPDTEVIQISKTTQTFITSFTTLDTTFASSGICTNI